MDFEGFQSHVQTLAFGKKLPEAIYLHKSALPFAPKELISVISGIASALKIADEDWDIIKLYKRDFKISYLSYPDFLIHPYPPIHHSYTVDLAKKNSRFASYVNSENPPVLHRRELFLHPSNPLVETFGEFTTEGEALGLYNNTRKIGTANGWLRAIRDRGCQLDDGGHIVPLRLQEKAPVEDSINQPIQRHKTAISRDKLSVPMFTLARLGYLNREYTILDYGCGRGDDVRELEANEIECIGWDPVLRPDVEVEACDIVNLGYVINVIEDKEERRGTLERAFELTQKLLVVSAMLGNESTASKFKPYKDGVVTKTNTFQKYYFQTELREYIERSLATEAIAAGPGLFFVFKDKLEEQRYLSERQRTRLNWAQISSKPKPSKIKKPSKSKIEQNEPLLHDFWQCCLELGRPATNEEFNFSDQLRHVFGSHTAALKICRNYYNMQDMEQSEALRRDDLLVYMALDHFGKRQVYRRMPDSLQKDIAFHFKKYQVLREEARNLLFSSGDIQAIESACEMAHATLPASVLTEDHDLVFQTKYLNLCPPLLRVYIGCATQLYGEFDSTNLIKAHVKTGKVTMMVYDGFEERPIPRLRERVKIKLKEQDIDFFDYVCGYKPQPLLFKSKLISKDDPSYEMQSKFDSSLLDLIGPDLMQTHLSADRLEYLLKEKNISIDGFEITKT